MNSPDRKSIPVVQMVNLERIPDVSEYKLGNNIPVFLINSVSNDLVKLDFIFKAGQVYEKHPLQASSTNMMLLEGSADHSAEEMNRLLDYFGTFPNLIIEKDSAGFSIIFLARYAEEIISLCREIIFYPAFGENEFSLLINKRLHRFLVNSEKVQVIAREKFFRSVFGNDHPYGRQVVKEDFEKISTDQIREFHSLFYDPSRLLIIVSGTTGTDLIRLLDINFGNLQVSGTASGLNIQPDVYPSRKEFIKKENSVQSAIRIGCATINKKHTDYQGLKIVNAILGGYFGSRLMKNIREDKGFTYGISSGLSSLAFCGYMVISTEVGSQYTKDTLTEIYKEITRLRNEQVRKDELDIVRGYMLGELVRMFDGPFAVSDSFRSVLEFGFDNTYYSDFARRIKSITPDEIIHLARSYYNIEEMHEIIAGSE